MGKTKTIYLLLCTLMGIALFGESLTIDEALKIAGENSLDLYTAERNLETSEREYRSRFNALYPSLTATAALNRANEASTISGLIPVNETGPGTGIYDQVMSYESEASQVSLAAGIQGSLTLNPAIGDGIKYLKLAYESSGLEREKAEAALERDVKVSFHNLLYLERSIELTQNSMETLRREYELARVDFQNGRISELQLLSTQVAYKNMEPILASQITNYKELRSSFFLLLGIDSDDELELEGTIELPVDTAGIIEINPDLNRRFDIAAIDMSLAQTEIDRQSTLHQSFFPSLTVSASWQPVVSDPLENETWDEGFSDPWSNTGSVGLTVAVPLDSWLPGSSARNSLAALDAGLDILAEQKETTARNALAEIELLRDKLNDSLLNIESLELNLTVARRAYELTEEGYRAGTQEFLALEEAEDDLNNAEQNLLQEKLNFLTTLFDFEYALNTELTEGEKL